MIRMYLVIKYFNKYRGNVGHCSAWYSGEIEKGLFVDHLFHTKHMCEDVRDKLRRLFFQRVLKKWDSRQHKKILDRLKKQRQKIKDSIDDCIDNGYFDTPRKPTPLSTAKETLLKCNNRGRRFLKFLPFIEAVLSKYSKTKSLIVGAGGGAILFFLMKTIIIWTKNIVDIIFQ